MNKERENFDVSNPKGTPYVKMKIDDYVDPNLTNLNEDKDLKDEISNNGLPTKGQVNNVNTSIQDLVEGLNYEYDDPRK